MKSWGKKTHLTLSLENAFTFLCIKPQETRKTPFTTYMIMGHRTTRTKLWRPTDCEWVRMKESTSWGHLCVPPSHCLSIIPRGIEVCLIEKCLVFFPLFLLLLKLISKSLGFLEAEVQILSSIRSQAGVCGGLAQSVECLPSLHEALGSIPSTAETGYGGTSI